MIWDVIDNKSKLIFKNKINKNNVNNAQEYLNAILADNVIGIILKIFVFSVFILCVQVLFNWANKLSLYNGLLL